MDDGSEKSSSILQSGHSKVRFYERDTDTVSIECLTNAAHQRLATTSESRARIPVLGQCSESENLNR
ncbi:hypothetical protein [Paraburkholderia bryophila]|uniref:Uncharacterized protein n=1 Tax=Paraburkholderia bryophila TaxID=420952 RepID=A0A7Y9W4T2_9BURK|nr:hypothetical protein [Paraburkholderia bryophila]NYH14214.1 hypothetical protein [Paraburkholderia bryophila]